MPATVVVFDPEGTLPSSFAADATSTRVVVRVESAAKAHRLARRAAIVVIVTGRDAATALGFLASVMDRRGARLVLFASNASHDRRVILHALRRGAMVLLEQPPSVLAECVRALVTVLPTAGKVA
jgi:hypothetical protein